jgi:hypothetical protein
MKFMRWSLPTNLVAQCIAAHISPNMPTYDLQINLRDGSPCENSIFEHNISCSHSLIENRIVQIQLESSDFRNTYRNLITYSDCILWHNSLRVSWGRISIWISRGELGRVQYRNILLLLRLVVGHFIRPNTGSSASIVSDKPDSARSSRASIRYDEPWF